jgi:putative transposase
MNIDEHPGLDRALKRFAVISQIEALVLTKESLGGAITKVFARQPDAANALSRASLYRWHKAYKTKGFEALFDEPRALKGSSLDQGFLDFIQSEKLKDPGASIPEVIARARERRVIGYTQAVDRSTVYRAALALNVPILRRKRAEETNMRPFAYEHRMTMVLCDGKHFRAGASKVKRVALIFIDDATRYVLDVFVGFSENSAFFLRSLHRVLETFGHMEGLYLDHGSAFTADDSVKVMASLKIPLIHGTVGYPQGRAKIERFNGTIAEDLLRGLDKPGIDPSCSALELRLRHYVREDYNQEHHSIVNGTPASLFENDSKALEFPLNHSDLKRAFVITETRKVRADNVIDYNGINYETPLGYSGRRITIYRDLLSPKIWVLHHGQAVELHPPDLAFNARERRSGAKPKPPVQGPITTAAELHFNRKFSSIVGIDGGFTDKPTQQGDNR